MRFRLSTMKPLSLIALVLGLAGCAQVEPRLASAAGRLSGTYDRFGPNWGGMRPTMPAESLTVQRIRGQAEPQATLRPEPGDVWPVEEGPRATLANPEEALRGVRSGEAEPRRNRGSSGFDNAPGAAPPVLSPVFEAPTPPPRANRTDGATAPGQVFPTAQGGSTVGTGGAGRVQSTISPQGSGLAIRDGGITTLIGPGGNVQQVPTPR